MQPSNIAPMPDRAEDKSAARLGWIFTYAGVAAWILVLGLFGQRREDYSLLSAANLDLHYLFALYLLLMVAGAYCLHRSRRRNLIFEKFILLPMSFILFLLMAVVSIRPLIGIVTASCFWVIFLSIHAALRLGDSPGERQAKWIHRMITCMLALFIVLCLFSLQPIISLAISYSKLKASAASLPTSDTHRIFAPLLSTIQFQAFDRLAGLAILSLYFFRHGIVKLAGRLRSKRHDTQRPAS